MLERLQRQVEDLEHMSLGTPEAEVPLWEAAQTLSEGLRILEDLSTRLKRLVEKHDEIREALP